jgi:hypothetical protein
MPRSSYRNLTRVILDQTRVQLRRYVSAQIAETVEVRPDPYGASVGDMIALDVITDLLTERLPPQTVTTHVHYRHPEAVGQPGTAVDARFATWLDHFTATYRGRWWARMLRLHKRPMRYTFVPVPYITSAAVDCNHKATVTILDTWRYPKAETTLRDIRGASLGEPVLWSDEHLDDARPITAGVDKWH